MTRKRACLAGTFLAVLITVSGASGADSSLALGDVAPPPVESGVDRASLQTAAERELRGVDVSRLPRRRNVVMSVAIVGSSQAPFGFMVNAVLSDAKTGTLLAILQGSAQASNDAKRPAVRQDVLHAALRSALQQIPAALAAS